MRRLRPRILLIVALLLAGTAVNVAVAWTCAYFTSPGIEAATISGQRTRGVFAYQSYLASRGGTTTLMEVRFQSGGIENWKPWAALPHWADQINGRHDLHAPDVVPALSRGRAEQHVAFAAGLPVRSLACEYGAWFLASEKRGGSIFFDMNRNEAKWRFGIRLRTHPVRVLPMYPLWPGFALNSLLFATAIWLPFIAPRQFVRWRRSKRGLCAKCAYPIGTSQVCTECGARVLAKTAIQSEPRPCGSDAHRMI